MGFYLLDHPPASRQYLAKRRAAETGCIVVHTPEGGVDLTPPDTKAESVAAYIARRSDPGSYHSIHDSDSTVWMMPWTFEAAQDGTGSNRWAVGISVACNAADWPRLLANHPVWVDGALAQLAVGACTYALDLHRRTGIVIPARWISKAQSDARMAGFITHGERDPGRRSDPGPAFPRKKFLEIYGYFAALNGLDVGTISPHPPPPEDSDMLYVVKAIKPGGTPEDPSTHEDQAWLTDLRGRQPINSQAYLSLLTSPYTARPLGPVVPGSVNGWYHAWTHPTVYDIPPAPVLIDVDALAAAIAAKLPPGTVDTKAIAVETAAELHRRLAS